MNSFVHFFSFSLIASVCHYFFQLLLARTLGNTAFADFAGLWAKVNFWMVLGTWAQYWSVLLPSSKSIFKRVFGLGHLVALVLMIVFILTNQLIFLFVAVVGASICHAILCGRLLNQANFQRMGIINVVAGVIKIILLLLIPREYLTAPFIFTILYTSFVLTHIFNALYPSQDAPVSTFHGSSSSFSGSLLLAFATHFFSGADLLWADTFQKTHSMATIAPLSLVSRGFFFLQMILAQWLLPQANLYEGQRKKWSLGVISGLVLLGSVLCTPVLMFLLEHALSWKNLPSFQLFYLSIVNAGFMAFHFQFMQMLTIKGKNHKVFIMLALILIVWAISGLRAVNIEWYFILQALFHFFAIYISFQELKKKNDSDLLSKTL